MLKCRICGKKLSDDSFERLVTHASEHEEVLMDYLASSEFYRDLNALAELFYSELFYPENNTVICKLCEEIVNNYTPDMMEHIFEHHAREVWDLFTDELFYFYERWLKARIWDYYDEV
ncbi:MAG: hypothetical protein ACPL3B_06220 [Fervidobacterium sp.]